jgi:hypothetical protein
MLIGARSRRAQRRNNHGSDKTSDNLSQELLPFRVDCP